MKTDSQKYTQQMMSAESTPSLQAADSKLVANQVTTAGERNQNKGPNFDRPNVTGGKIKLREKNECDQSSRDTTLSPKHSDMRVTLSIQPVSEALKGKQQEVIEATCDDSEQVDKDNSDKLWNTALDSLEKTLPYVQQYVKERRNQKSPLVDPKLLNEFHSKVAALKSEGVKTNDSKVLRVSKHLEKLNKQVSDKSTVWLADLYDESPRRAQSLARGLNETIKVLSKVADSLTHSLAVTDIELAEQAIDKAIEEVNELDHGDTLAAMDSHTKKMRSRETSQKIPELLRVPFPKEAIELFDEARKICNTARPVINKQAQAQADKKKQADTADRYGIATLKSAVEGTFCQQDGVEELIGLIDRLSNDKAQKWLGNTKQKHKDTFDQHLKGITHNLSLLVDIYQNPDNYQDAETWIAIRDTLDKSMTGYKKLFKKVENSWSNAPIDTLNRRYGNQATRFFSDAHYLFSEIKNVIPKNLTEKKTATSQFSHGVKNGLRSASTAANKLMQVMASTAHGLSDQVDFRGRSEAEILNASHHQRLVDSGVRALFYQLEQPAQSVSRGADRLYKLMKDLTPIKGELNLERAGALRPEDGQLKDLNLHLDGMIAEIEKNLQELTGKTLDELASLDMTKLWEEKINSDKRRLLQSFKEDGEQAANDIKEIEHKWDGLARPLGERITGGGYAYNVLVPDVASKTAKAVKQIASAVVKAKKRQFNEAKVNAKTAHSIASAATADIEQRAPRGLDDYSKGSHVAKYWATKLNETLQLKLGDSIPSPGQLLTDMKKRGYLVCDPIRVGQSTLSKKDPVGLHMATQVVGELEKLRRGERVAPITQQEYVDEVAKGIVAHMVKWGQRQATGKATYFAVELAFEHGLDAVTLGLSRAIKTSVSATKAAIKIPYALHQAKKHTGVEEDWDYKALDKLLKDKLSYHAAKVGISWLPSEVKGAVGAGIWGVAELKNINTRALEATVNETHARVISGKKSKQFKTSSAEVIAFDVVVGASLTGAGKGIDRAWEARREAQLEAQAEKVLNEERQPADLMMNLIASAYQNIDRGKEEYKEAVDASLAKIASTPFGRDLIESMAQQGIRITMPSDSAYTLKGEHDHETSAGNYANPDNDTVFFDPSYKPSAEDVKDRPWLDCDPAIVLFHEMLHLHYSENPIQFEVSGQTYQFGGKGDPISEHMVAGVDYVSEQGVEFRFSDPKWVKQHLKVGKYVNENDLRRALKQPIREGYYFDARNTGENQARFYNENGEDDSFGRTLYVAMNALRSDTGFRLPKTGDFSNKEREVWDKLADDLPIKASGQVGFSLSESRFIRDHSHLYSAEKLAHTIEYYHRNGLTPWYDNSARLDRDFYFRLSDITLDNGHVIESEDIQLYLELYGGPEKFVEDNVDSALGGKETLVVDMVAQRIDDIRTGQNSIASVNENFFYRSFITDYFTKRNIKASTPVVGYHSEGHFREGNFHPHGHLTTGPNWKSDIQAFTAALESAGYTGPFKEVDFDETFYWYEGQHLRAYYDVEDLARHDHRDCIQRVERVYVYRGAEDKDLIYVSGQIVEVPRHNGRQNIEIDMPPEVFSTLDGPVLMMGGDIKLILPRKKMETLMTVATRRDTASYTYQISNEDYHTVQDSDVQTEFTEKLDSRFEGNNRQQIEEAIERQLKYAPLMRIHSELDSDKEDIKKWLNEFSSGTRQGIFASHECVISDINSIQNPDVFYIPLSQGDSTKYDGLMINWVRGEVIPIPRDLKQRLTLFKTPQFRSSFTESLSQSNIDRLLVKTGQYGTWGKMDNISGYLNELRSASPLDMDQKIEILNMCLDYVAMVAVGQKNPDDDETQALLDLFDYVRPDWGGKVINGLSRSEEADILYSSRMNNFVATMHLQTSYHSLEGREYSVDQFPNKLTDFLVDKLHKDFDYHVTSASEESTQRLIESLREPLRWSSYVLAVGLGAAFPGFAAGVIGGMVTTFLTDTVLDIVQLETEDSLEKRQELLEGIIAKCYTSLGAELGGAVLGPAAGKLVKWMTKTVSRKILGESSEEVMQMIDNIDLRTIQQKIDIERGVSSQNVIKTRWGRIRSHVKAENPTARARKSPIMRELTEEQRTELLENQMSDTLRKYSTFESIVDNTVKIRDVLKAAAILGVINELMLEVDKALDPNISGNAFYQIVKMWFVYSLAGASGEVLNIKTADDLLEEAMTKLDVPPQKRMEFLQKVRDERISKQKLLGDPQVQDAKAAMDSTDPVVSSTRELVGPDGRSNQEVDYYPEDNWSDEANRLMRLLDNRDLTHMAPDIAEVPLAVGEDLKPREMGAIPKRQRKDGNRMQEEEQHLLADRTEANHGQQSSIANQGAIPEVYPFTNSKGEEKLGRMVSGQFQVQEPDGTWVLNNNPYYRIKFVESRRSNNLPTDQVHSEAHQPRDGHTHQELGTMRDGHQIQVQVEVHQPGGDS